MISSRRSDGGGVSSGSSILLSIMALLMISTTIVDGFVVPSPFQHSGVVLPARTMTVGDVSRSPLVLAAAAEKSGGGSGGKKKRKRRRRKSPPTPTSDASTVDSGSSTVSPPPPPTSKVEESSSSSSVDLDREANEAMDFGFDDEIKLVSSREKALDLPNIRDAMAQKRQRKKEEAFEAERMERRRISRSDKDAMARLLEMDPLADDDKRNFEEEEYTTVSALLAEGAKPFLGITSGQLQVGHFILSLGIILMAYVEYPGFPLTNLPTPLRECLQSGLGTVYVVNTVLAILAVFKAMERDQPPALWAAKSFSVGGLAFDQLTQLPTKEEMRRMNEVKGSRGRKKLARR